MTAPPSGPIEIPPELEEAAYRAVEAALGPLTPSVLARAVVDRSERYTSARHQLAQTGPHDLAARAAFFTIADAMKLAVPLRELARRGAIPGSPDGPLRILDLGAGCGAMGLGAIAELGPRPLAITMIDRDGAALAIGRTAIAGYAAARATPVEVTARTGDVTRFEIPAGADLIVAATVLNELAADAALAVVERALEALAPDGALILLEPALRDTTRALHAIRDAVIARGRGHVFAPCTRRGAPCPMLADPDDWCHEDRSVTLPPRTAALARLTHLRDSGLKFSYLVLRRQPLDLVPAGDRAWRIVAAPRVAKGKLEFLGCSVHGHVPLRLLTRHKSDATKPLVRAGRGDIVTTDAEPDGERVEVLGTSRVEIA